MDKETICDNSEVAAENRRSCDAQGIGYLIRGLGQMGLWPLPEPSFVTDVSLEDLSSMLSNIQFDTYYHKYYKKTRCGDYCSKLPTYFKAAVEQVISKHPATLIEAHQRHLGAQSKR